MRAVRRFLAILLLAFLPLQFGWAAVESYCVDEVLVVVEEPGHHAHPQHAEAAPGADADGSADTSACIDCHCHCHGHCTGILCNARGVADQPPTVRPGAALDAAGRAHAPTRPERPQWARFA